MVPECQDDDTSGENDGCQLGAVMVQYSNTPFYINVDLYKNREL